MLDAVAVAIERCHELFEHLTLIAIVGIADALEGTTQRKGRHRERTILRGGIAYIHILDALARCHRAGSIQVNLEVLHRLECHAQLQILGLIGRGGRGNAITHEQPVVLACLFDVGVADESESKIKSRRHQTAPSRLSEGIADIRQESRQRHRVLVAIAQAGIANHHQHTCYSLRCLVPALIVEWFLGCERELHLRDGHLKLRLLFLLLRTPDTWSRRTLTSLFLRIALHGIVLQGVGSQCLRTGYRISSERVGQRLEGSEGVGLDLLGQRLWHPHLDLILVHHLIFQRILLAVLGLRGERETLGLLAVLHFNDGIGQEFQFLLKALRILRQFLLLVVGLLIGIELSGVGTVSNGFSACLLLFCLLLARLFLRLFLLLLFLLQLAGTLLLIEAFVGLLQERHHIIKLLEVERSVEVQRAVVIDDITKRRAVLEVGTTHPAISGVVRCVGIQPLEDGQQVQRQLVAGLERLAIVEWRAEVAQGVLHRVFPCIVAVWIEVFVDGCIGLFHLGMSGTLEVHVQILRQVPTQREVTIPKELFAKA